MARIIDELAADEKCPHCDRAWHSLRLTRQVDRMFSAGRFDADYFSREDLSPVLCDGSTFIGPLRPEPTYASGGIIAGGKSPAWIATLYDSTMTYVGSLNVNVKLWLPGDTESKWATLTTYQGIGYGLGIKSVAPWVIFDEPYWKDPEPVCTGPVPEVDVEFGPQNWLPAMEHVYVPPETKTAVGQRWHHFTRPEEIPAPKSPGYDFTVFDTVEPKYPTSRKGKNHHEGF